MMDQWYLDKLYRELWSKPHPNTHEKYLFEKTQKYIKYIAWIPGIEMIAVCNSLAFYATHEDSDIDLFIITEPQRLWIVRTCITCIFSLLGVWRKHEDIRGNFCLSFFITKEAMNLESIAIEDDIYLLGWIKTLKPILNHNDTYNEFLEANREWIQLAEEEKQDNLKYVEIIKNKIPKNNVLLNRIEQLLKTIFFPKTLRQYNKLGKPWWVILSEHILKFHDQDRRKIIREKILQKNFDK
jgi:hypothetical protein